MEQQDLDIVNEKVKEWKNGAQKELKRQFTILKIEHVERSPSTTPAVRLLKNRVGYRFGMAERISFKFPKHMVFVHKGVGGGNTANRTKKEWMNPVMDQEVPKLADSLSEVIGDIAIGTINIH